MTGNKTHEQQLRIIEEQENTKNADDDFDTEAELGKSNAERETFRKGSDLRSKPSGIVDSDDRNIIRGENQEGPHHKNRADE